MHGVGQPNSRRFLVGLIVGSLCGVVGCGPGGGSQGPLDSQKVEQHRKTTSEYMKGVKNRGRAEARGGPNQKP
jgi:hypothetical protein